MIRFFCEDIQFEPEHPINLANWLSRVFHEEGRSHSEINYIFCSDSYLLDLNHQYLNKDDFTDIITFDHSDSLFIRGDVFISIERVRENAKELRQDFLLELRRVMVHGILHLMGYQDSTPNQQQEMRKKEDAYLSLYA